MQDDIKDFAEPNILEERMEQSQSDWDARVKAEHRANLNFHKEVWDKLSRIDVGDHIKTADIRSETGASYTYQYLSWSWAWATLMKAYPASTYTILEEEKFDDGTVNVRLVLTVRDLQGYSLDRFCFLPVMDRRNNSIKNPSSRHVNDARQRCLVKAMAFCGLGLDLWAGSDIPVGATEDPVSPEQLDIIEKLIEKAEPDMVRFLKWLKVDTVEDIPLSKYKQTVAELERSIRRKGEES